MFPTVCKVAKTLFHTDQQSLWLKDNKVDMKDALTGPSLRKGLSSVSAKW